ncbi:MAG: DegV family protein [Candidatus Omnitrophota bacterium]|nr:MAG: DegV family protein [Candidatus Omnitrophota bacterium]
MRIVTDSTVDLPSSLVEKYNIEIVPLKVQLGEETYRDYFEIEADKFYQKLRSTTVFPTTTQPSPQDFLEVYQRVSRENDCVISLHISSKLSGTYQSAIIASQRLLTSKVYVIDSKQASVGLGLIVLAVAHAIEKGRKKEEILQLIDELTKKIRTFFSVDSLEYLQRGGRIGKAQAFLGTILKIKPLLTLVEGEIHPVEKIRGEGRLLKRMAQLVEDEVSKGKIKMGLIYTDNEETMSILSQYLERIENLEIVYKGRAGGVITSHTGPGTIGISYYNE